MEYQERVGYSRSILLDLFLDDAINRIGVLHARIPKGKITDKHYHAKFKELFISLTEGIIGVRDREYKLNPGDLLLVDAQEVHWAHALNDFDFEIIAIKIPHIPDDRVSVSK